jgi:hypothetical protein
MARRKKYTKGKNGKLDKIHITRAFCILCNFILQENLAAWLYAISSVSGIEDHWFKSRQGVRVLGVNALLY